MASMNHVLLMGNLTRDPDVRQLAVGGTICKFGLAVNRRYQTRSGEDREETCFVDIDVFGRQAETVGQYLNKGRPVLVEGRLRQDRWEDRNTGQKMSRLVVVAQRVQFLGRPDRESSNRHPEQHPQPSQEAEPTPPDCESNLPDADDTTPF